MQELDVSIELTDLTNELLGKMAGESPLCDDTVVVELTKRDDSLYLKCPICRATLDGTLDTVECILDGTLYMKECAQLMADQNEKCLVCNLMSFKEMLEIS